MCDLSTKEQQQQKPDREGYDLKMGEHNQPRKGSDT